MSLTVNLGSLAVASYVTPTEQLLVYSSGILKRLHKNAVFVKRPPVDDLNLAVSTGYYPLNTVEPKLNAPDGVCYGVLLVFDDNTMEDMEFVQVILGLSPICGIYIRKKGSSSGWGPWNKMSYTILGGGVNYYSSTNYAILQKGGLRDEWDNDSFQRFAEEQDGGCDGGQRPMRRLGYLLNSRNLYHKFVHKMCESSKRCTWNALAIWNCGSDGKIRHYIPKIDWANWLCNAIHKYGRRAQSLDDHLFRLASERRAAA